tara:strand:- start:1931 stop:2896 length:966 start_codon:yes stop_codon:yes gene_type:complete
MAKLIKTHPKDLLNLQNGYYAHFVEDGIAINDVKTYEPRHRISRINDSSDVKTFRIALNIVLTIAIFTAIYITDFVPLALLMFAVLYDLRTVKRINLPVNKSNFIPFVNIVDVEMIAGKLGFNSAQINIKDDNGKLSVKTLKLYDSDSTWERSKDIFTHLKYLRPLKKKSKDVSGLKQIKINEGISYAVEADKLLYLENGKFDLEREDPYKYFRFLTSLGLFVLVVTIGKKVVDMINLHQFTVIDFVVLAFFIWLASVPFRLGKRSNPNIVDRADIKSIEVKKKDVLIKIKGWGSMSFIIKLNKRYIAEETIDQLNTFYKG